MEFTRPRGTRDFLFDEMSQRKQVENKLRNVFENYGYGEVNTPLFEELKLFTTKSGEEIVDQLYNFKDKSDRELALRPEITAAIARLYLNELSKTAKPIKLYYYGSCFRYERPQKGRFRQFWQFGCELIGAKSPEGEAEVIAMANESIEELGIDTAEIHINHLGIIRGLFAHYGISQDKSREVMIVVDKGDKDLLKEALTGEDAIIDNMELANILLSKGFEKKETHYSMGRDLHGYSIPEETEFKFIKLREKGYKIENFTYKYSLELLDFLKNEFGGGWKRNALIAMQKRKAEERIILVLDRDNRICGFSMRTIDDNPMRFGPIGIAQAKRNEGIGSILLHYSMYEMAKKGIYHMFFMTTDEDGKRYYIKP